MIFKAPFHLHRPQEMILVSNSMKDKKGFWSEMQWSWNEPGTVTLNWCFFTHGTRNCEAILQFSHVPRVVSHWAPQVQRPEKTKHPTRRHLAEITGRMVASWAHKANFRAIRFLKTSLYFVHHLGNDNLQLHLVGDVLKKNTNTHKAIFY